MAMIPNQPTMVQYDFNSLKAQGKKHAAESCRKANRMTGQHLVGRQRHEDRYPHDAWPEGAGNHPSSSRPMSNRPPWDNWQGGQNSRMEDMWNGRENGVRNIDQWRYEGSGRGVPGNMFGKYGPTPSPSLNASPGRIWYRILAKCKSYQGQLIVRVGLVCFG